MLRATRENGNRIFYISPTRLSLSLAVLSKTLSYVKNTGLEFASSNTASHNTHTATHASLHDTGLGSSQFAHHYYGNHFVFFSWHYLDVSVHAVSPQVLCIQTRVIRVYQIGLPHSETSGSKLVRQLPEDFGSLLPPSSPLDTKASTKCSF